MNKDEIIREVLNIIRRYLSMDKFEVFLFGSTAKDNQDSISDIDIGLLGKEKIDDFLMLRLKKEIEGIATLRKIDLVDLNKTDDEFKRKILTYARKL